MEHSHNDLKNESNKRLDLFESEWVGGTIPDISAYMRDAVRFSGRYIPDLLELDLEYRWRRFEAGANCTLHDEFGFPLFPLLEHYTKLLSRKLQPEILVPKVIAEEYRVRRRWGDRPTLESYFARFPDDPRRLKAALENIEAEFLIEGITSSEEGMDSLIYPSTVVNSNQSDGQVAVSTPLSTSQTMLGKYRLDELAGRGSYGEVWKAYDENLKRTVAIKIPRPDRIFPFHALKGFVTEAQKLASLGRLPGVVRVYDCGEESGYPYIVSEFIEGKSLKDLIDEKELTFEKTVELVISVSESLHGIHKKSLVHRDIKPSNILLTDEGEPFIADFGLSITEEEQLSERRGVVGTWAYMPPEQSRGNGHRTDGRADIYAVGATLYHMLTGRPPFVAETSEGYLDLIENSEPRPLRSIDDQIPVELERICLKCLAKQSTDRYATSRDLANDLRGWLQPEIPLEPPSSKNWLTPAVTLTGILVLLGITELFFLRKENGQKNSLPYRNDNHRNIAGGLAPKSAIETEWIQELGQRPRELIWPGHDGNAVTAFREDLKAYEIAGDGIRLIELGQMDADSENARLGITIQQPVWRGGVGVFVGYQETEFEGLPAAQFHLISGSRFITIEGEHVFRIKRTLTIINPRAGSTLYKKDCGHVDLPWPGNASSTRVELVFHKQKLIAGNWAGHSVIFPEFRHMPQITPEESQGSWGIFAVRNTSWFRSPSFSKR